MKCVRCYVRFKFKTHTHPGVNVFCHMSRPHQMYFFNLPRGVTVRDNLVTVVTTPNITFAFLRCNGSAHAGDSCNLYISTTPFYYRKQ